MADRSAGNSGRQSFFLPVRLTPSSSVLRFLTCSPVSDALYPGERSIRIHNVPPLITDKNLRVALERIAPLEKVVVEGCSDSLARDSLPIDYHLAVAVFADAAGVSRLKEVSAESPVILSAPLGDAHLLTPLALRLERQAKRQQMVQEWKETADEVVRLYDEEVQLKGKVIKACSGEVDDEGWQVVRRSRPDSLNKEKALLARISRKEDKKKRLEANVAHMYQYRMRDEKLGKLRLLRKKFEEDKFKLALMKAGRKFRPI